MSEANVKSAQQAWKKIKASPEAYEARREAISRGRSGVSVGSRKGIGGWKVKNRIGTAHKCTGPDCINGRHKPNSGSFQVGSTQTHPRSLANLAEWRERQREWSNGTSYEGRFTYILRAQVWERDQGQCQDCNNTVTVGERTGVVHHIDFDKGHNELGNLILLCRSCHMKRHDRDWHGRIRNQPNLTLG